MKRLLLLILAFPVLKMTFAQEIIRLYDGPVPNSKTSSIKERTEVGADGNTRISLVSEPTLKVFLPSKEKANGTAVIICPGGGYVRLSATHEGDKVAQVMAEWGVTAFVLKYRLPDDSLMQQKEIGPLQDAQRAIQLVRQRAKEWNINPKEVGIMGFSAGGHLASTLGTHFEKAVIANKTKVNLRPDFMILMYPVISFTDSLAHKGSRDRLIGTNPSEEKIKYYSNEMQVTKKTPNTFLVHAKDDRTVKYQNSIVFSEAVKKKHVPSEVHLFEKGGHGFGLVNSTTNEKWSDWLKVWMEKYKYL